jgi:hypothetical protein
VAGANLKETCEVLGRVPGLVHDGYAALKLKSIQQAIAPLPANAKQASKAPKVPMTPKVVDGDFRLADLMPVITGMGLGLAAPMAQATLASLAQRIAKLPLCKDVDDRTLRRSLAEICAAAKACGDGARAEGIAAILNVLAGQPACTRAFPGLKGWSKNDPLTWSNQLLLLVDLADAPEKAKDGQPAFVANLPEGSVTLAEQLCDALLRTARKGHYTLKVAPKIRRPLLAQLQPRLPEFGKAGLQLAVVGARQLAVH